MFLLSRGFVCVYRRQVWCVFCLFCVCVLYLLVVLLSVCVCVCKLSIISSTGQKRPACLRAYLLFRNEHRLRVQMYSVCVCVSAVFYTHLRSPESGVQRVCVCLRVIIYSTHICPVRFCFRTYSSPYSAVS